MPVDNLEVRSPYQTDTKIEMFRPVISKLTS